MFSDAAPVLIAASLCGFAFQFAVGQVIREARLQLPVQAAEGLVLTAIGLGFAASFRAHRRAAERSPDRRTLLSINSKFAAAALLCAFPLFIAAWSTAALEGFREFLALRSIAPQSVLRCVLALQLLAGASCAAFFAVRAVLALHDWHRRVLHQRLRAAVLWVALAISACLGGAVVLLVRDANRYWPVPALLFSAAAALAALTRSQASETQTSTGTRWPQAPRKSWIVCSILLAAMTAAVALPPPPLQSSSMIGSPMSLVVLMLGGCGGFLMARLASRLHINVQFVPLALPLAAFVQSAAPSFALRALLAAILLLAAFALLIQHAARAMHSIPDGLASLGLTGSLGFAAVALLSALFANEFALSYYRLVVMSACVVAAGLLAWRAGTDGAARPACITACFLWLLVGPFLPARANRLPAPLETADAFRADIRRRLNNLASIDVSPNDGLEPFQQPHGIPVAYPFSRLWDGCLFDTPDLESSDRDILIIAPGPLTPASAQALRAGRWLRRLSRGVNVGGRLIFEEPLDEQLAATLDRYAKRARLPFGPIYDLRIRGPASEYRAAIIGPDVEPWLAERAWPNGCQVRLQARE